MVGKPSALALEILKSLPQCRTLYDAMDDFPAFYSGYSQSAMKRRELNIVAAVDNIWTSSTLLYQKWSSLHKNVYLVYNAMDIDIVNLIKTNTGINSKRSSRKIFGYIGTVGKWFDWEMVIALAKAMPDDLIRIIGPVFKSAPTPLPANIEMLPPCEHSQALAEMIKFDVGLIPFLQNELTSSVDPIKYYEYRAFGIPIISSNFGEMSHRANSEGVHLVENGEGVDEAILRACNEIKERRIDQQFSESNSWTARFNQAEL